MTVCLLCSNSINGKHRAEDNHNCLVLEESSIPPVKAALEAKIAAYESKVAKFRELRKSSLADQQGCLESVEKVFGEVRSILAAKESEMVSKINCFFSISAASPEELLASCDNLLALSRQALDHTHTNTAHVNSTQGGPLPLHTIKEKLSQVNISSFLSEFFFFKYFFVDIV
jgi:hypothetical protein